MLRLQSLALAMTTAIVAASQSPAAPDLILVNGRVFTADARVPWAEAVAVRPTESSTSARTPPSGSAPVRARASSTSAAAS